VGVQNTAEGCIYCGHQFQFPYCTWEFKKPAGHKSGRREVSIPILHVGVQSGNAQAPSQAGAFQFPYCTWEFKPSPSASHGSSAVSIPILHVGVLNYVRKFTKLCGFNSHTARGSSTASAMPILSSF